MPNDLRTPLALSILALLRVQAMHPYEMQRLMRDWSIDEIVRLRAGSLYSTIARLFAAGLVDAVGTSRDGRRPERTTYRLTEAGRGHLTGWMRELIVAPTEEYPWFGSAVAFIPLLTPAELREMFAERAGRLATRLADDDALDPRGSDGEPLPRAFRLGHEYATAMRRAELDWVRGVVADLDSGRFAWPAILRDWQDHDAAMQGDYRLPHDVLPPSPEPDG